MKKNIIGIIIDYALTALIFIILEGILFLIAYYNPNSWIARGVIINYWWAYDLGAIIGFAIVAAIKIAIYVYKNKKNEN